MTRALRRRHRIAVVLLGVATVLGVVLALAVRPILPPLATAPVPIDARDESRR